MIPSCELLYKLIIWIISGLPDYDEDGGAFKGRAGKEFGLSGIGDKNGKA